MLLWLMRGAVQFAGDYASQLSDCMSKITRG